MMTRKGPVCSLIARQTMLALVAASSLLGDAILAGEDKPLPSPIPASLLSDGSVSQVRVFRIENADADSIVRPLVFVDPTARIQSDQRTNSVIVLASAETQRRIEQLIKQLDTSEPDKAIPIRVLPLEGRSLSDHVLPILANLFGKEGAQFATDTHTNTLIVQAPETTQLAVIEFLDMLERASRNRDERKDEAASTSHTVQVRAIWLASGLAGDNLPEPAEDLKDVVAELSKIGVGQLRQVGQSIVRTTDNGQFQLSCTPVIGQDLGDWSMKAGFVQGRNGQQLPEMQIQLTASKPEVVDGADTPSEKVTLTHLETVVSAPYGHFVVLCVTPVANATSVFVVQITRDE